MQATIVRSAAILIAESNPTIAQDTTEALRGLGYDPMVARDALSAILVLDDRIDLLFAAIAMPKIDGFMLADMAKSHRPRISVIYTTDDMETANKRMETAGRVHGPILKLPYSQMDLESAIVDAFAFSDTYMSRRKQALGHKIFL